MNLKVFCENGTNHQKQPEQLLQYQNIENWMIYKA